MEKLFQTSLYFFSALLQADAAILGFGTIFIIYKLQALNSLKQNIIQAYYTKGTGHISNINSLLFLKDPKSIAKILTNASEYDRENYINIICIPRKIKQIGRYIKLPIWIIGSHAVCSSFFLLSSYHIYKNINIQNFVLIVIFIWFTLGLFLAGRLAIITLNDSDKFKLKELYPEVYNELKNN